MKRSSKIKMLMTMMFGSSESLIVADTYQFDDYSKYVSSFFDPELKAKRRQEVFLSIARKRSRWA